MPKDRDGVRRKIRSTHKRKGEPAKNVEAVNREIRERKEEKYRKLRC